jgi:hypothetical protein
MGLLTLITSGLPVIRPESMPSAKIKMQDRMMEIQKEMSGMEMHK